MADSRWLDPRGDRNERTPGQWHLGDPQVVNIGVCTHWLQQHGFAGLEAPPARREERRDEGSAQSL